VEVQRHVDPVVHRLLVRQVDSEADRRRAHLPRAAVGGLHGPRAAAGDDREALLTQPPRKGASPRVARVVARRARRAEHRHGLADVREPVEAGAQLVLHAQEPLRVGELGKDRRRLRLQQLLVQRPRVAGRMRLADHPPRLGRAAAAHRPRHSPEVRLARR
jgi:hypothetical protein